MSNKVKIILIISLVLILIGVVSIFSYRFFSEKKEETKQVISEEINNMEESDIRLEKNEEDKEEPIVVIINTKKNKKTEDTQNKEETTENQEENNVQNENTNNTEQTVTNQVINTPEYYIKVNYGANVINVYGKDENGNYTVPCKSFICSTGRATPRSGAYNTDYKYRWVNLFGNVYGQYATRIVGNILFHSVPYLEKGNKASLEYWEYDKLRNSSFYGVYKNDSNRC